MSCCAKILDVLKEVLSSLGPILAIALICFAAYLLVFASPGFVAAMEGFISLPAFLTGLEASTWAYIAAGAAVVVSPETVTDMASGVGHAVGKVVSNVAGAIIAGAVGGASGFFSGGLGQGLLWAGAAYLAYVFLVKDKDEAGAPSVEGGSGKRRSGDSGYDSSEQGVLSYGL